MVRLFGGGVACAVLGRFSKTSGTGMAGLVKPGGGIDGKYFLRELACVVTDGEIVSLLLRLMLLLVVGATDMIP